MLPGQEVEKIDGLEFRRHGQVGPPGRGIAPEAGPGLGNIVGMKIDAGVGGLRQQLPVEQAFQHGADAAADLQHPQGRRLRGLQQMPGQGFPDVPVQGAVVQVLFGGQIAAEAVFFGDAGHLFQPRRFEKTSESTATARTPQISNASQALPRPRAAISSLTFSNMVEYGTRLRPTSKEVKNITTAISIKLRLEKI